MNVQALASVVVVVALVGVGTTVVDSSVNPLDQNLSVSTFESAEQFTAYIEEGGSPSTSTFTAQAESADLQRDQTTEASPDAGGAGSGGGGEPTVNRFSETNVQEEGIQEPDILKSDGERFFFSPERSYGIARPMPTVRRDVVGTTAVYPQPVEQNITAFNTLPAENVSELGEIDASGRMLLYEGTLIVFGEESIRGFDVSDAESPDELYERSLNGSVVTSRRMGDRLYVVVQQSVDEDDPCPIRPMETTSVPCTDIYHPRDPVPADATYTVVELSVETGEVRERTSMVGTAANTNVYMSDENLYMTYRDEMSENDILFDFLLTDGRDLLNETTVEQIENVSGYDIGDRAKRVELGRIIRSYQNSLGEDERRDIEEKFQNRLGNYTDEHKREFVTTGIVRVGLDDLAVEETGEVPGWTLDQFSMDEHEGRLRLATTVGSGRLSAGTASANDLYILDEDLDIQSSVLDMGVTERIYSVRFLEDTAYIVTFRRIDPFHVLDLSNPDDPVLEGELKLPGFSSYLHPIDEDRVLGIGEENRQAKVVMFNVTDPTEPAVAEDVILDEYGTEIGDTHHAFLIDRKHEVFFIPGQSQAYIFSYADGMDVAKTVSVHDPARARFVNNYLYVFGNQELVVLNETNWSEVTRVSFHERQEYDQPEPREPTIEESRGETSDLNLSTYTLIEGRVDNSGFESYEKGENTSIADWNIMDGNTHSVGITSDGIDNASAKTTWESNGGDVDPASVSQDVNLSGVEAIGIDVAGGGGAPFRSKISLYVNGEREGTFVTGPQTETTYRELGVELSESYEGEQTVEIRWTHITGDNLGSSMIDNVRVYGDPPA